MIYLENHQIFVNRTYRYNRLQWLGFPLVMLVFGGWECLKKRVGILLVESKKGLHFNHKNKDCKQVLSTNKKVKMSFFF